MLRRNNRIWRKGLVCKSSTVTPKWYNTPGDITKEFWEKAIQFHGTFHGLKIKNCKEEKIFFHQQYKKLLTARKMLMNKILLFTRKQLLHLLLKSNLKPKKIDLKYFESISSLQWIFPEQFPEKNLWICSFLLRI